MKSDRVTFLHCLLPFSLSALTGIGVSDWGLDSYGAFAQIRAYHILNNDLVKMDTVHTGKVACPAINTYGTHVAFYRETGSGMGAALNTAAALDAYLLADRGTWLAFRNRGSLDILVEGDERLFNQYGVILVNPSRHTHVKRADGQAFIDWLVSAEGQAAIAAFRINGEQAFFPDARTK